MERQLALLGMTSVICLSACESFTRETFGEVTVGQPQVFRREGLLDERFDDIVWVDVQIARPFEQGRQGIRDFREASATAMGVRLERERARAQLAAIDVEQGVGQRGRNQEIPDLEHRIEVVGPKKKLAAAEEETERSAPANEASLAPMDLCKRKRDARGIIRNLGQIEPKLKPASRRAGEKSVFADPQDRLVNPAIAEGSTAQVTQLDSSENESTAADVVHAPTPARLMDTHDLLGSSLSEMTFDTTIMLGETTWQKALIGKTADSTARDRSGYVTLGFTNRLKHRKQEDANLLPAWRHQRLATGRLSGAWRDCALRTVNEFEPSGGICSPLELRAPPGCRCERATARPLAKCQGGRSEKFDTVCS